MPYARFLQVVKTAAKAKSQEAKEHLRSLAFLGWQMYRTQPFAGPKRLGLREWLIMLGLEDKPEVTMSEEEKKAAKEKALAEASKIIELDRRRAQRKQ